MDRKTEVEAIKLLAPVGITAGLAILFFGVSGRYNHWPGAWTDIIAGAVLTVIGLILLFVYLNSVKSQDEKEKEGRRMKTTVRTPADVEAMLKDLGVGEDDLELKEAVRKFCLDTLQEVGGPLDNLDTEALGFGAGYEAALRKYKS